MEFIIKKQKSIAIPKLTRCEKDVLNYLLEGMNNREIAIKLNVSIETIKSHRSKIYTKHNVHSLAFLLKFYLK